MTKEEQEHYQKICEHYNKGVNMRNKYSEMYEQNKDFKEYVDKYCKALRHNKTPMEAFKDIVVKSYFDYIEEKGDSCNPYEYQKNCNC